MPYDERHAEYIESAGLLPFVLQFRRRPRKMNSTTITALVDRWRPKTHSFHLPCGEMTSTLQDFAMIMGLPIDGAALTGRVGSDGWRDPVAGLFSVSPAPPALGEKDTRPTGVSFVWLREARGGCPPGAEPVTVQ